ncbi:MAG: hypothetical protein ABIN48_12565 [Ginsengibacter sp.]
MSNCNCHKDDLKDGSAQFSRYLKALDPSYAPIDDRSMEELLIYIKDYAARIRFFDIPESQLSTDEPISWQEFFSKDMAVIAAAIRLTDVTAAKKSYDKIRTELEQTGNRNGLVKLFEASLELAHKMNDWFKVAIPENPLYEHLKTAIQSTLGSQVNKIMSYEEGFRLVFSPEKMNLDYKDLEDNELWQTDSEILADLSIYEGTTEIEKVLNAALYADEVFQSFLGVMNSLINKTADVMKYALEAYPGHQPHMALFISFLKLFQLAQEQLNKLPGRMLDYYYKDVLRLTSKDAQPDKVHIVFELAKDIIEYPLDKNTPLKAGKDVSGIEQIYKTQDELVINQVKVKEIKTVFIEKEQLDNGEKGIRSIYANSVANSADGQGAPFDTDYAAWPAFGKDGSNSELTGDLCEAIKLLEPSKEKKTSAQIGFAVASPQLLLRGGNRLAMLKSFKKNILFERLQTGEIVNPFVIHLTGESGWMRIDQSKPWTVIKDILDKEGKEFTDAAFQINEPFYSINTDEEESSILLFLPISAEGIIPYNSEIHEGASFQTDNPVMQLLLNNEIRLSEKEFNTISFENFTLIVKVGSMKMVLNENGLNVGTPSFDGLQHLVLQNDEQILEAGKSFDPFTANPFTGKSLYIGSEEIFNKPLGMLSINIRNATGNNTTYQLYLLQHKQWVLLSYRGDAEFFSLSQLAENVLQGNEKVITLKRTPVNEVQEYSINTTKGFLRLDLGSTLRLEGQKLREALEVKEISLNYISVLPQLEQGVDQFFHVYPFGVAELAIPLSINRNALASGNITVGVPGLRQNIPQVIAEGVIQNLKNNLLPQFTYTDLYKNADTDSGSRKTTDEARKDLKYPKIISAVQGITANRGKIDQYYGTIQEEGLLFIGLENAEPLQSVSLLFQFAEGSAADEDHDPPEIHWSFLSNNQWIPFNGEDILSDDTGGFQTTGIIKFSLPANITNDHTIITTGLSWIRASVTEYAERIPRVINIFSQAVLAIFNDQGNSPAHYDDALKAESIQKLQNPDSRIAKVIQPFSSFDGKHAEIGKEFQTRISERLRHKQRAVTSWDYEHLVLERFSSVFKVKCINHADPNCLCREKKDDSNTVQECCGPQIAPGHVLLIPIANLKNRNAVNPLQPKTSQRVLIDMVQYVKKYSSPFVKVAAKNPVYEQVIVFFRVQFISGADKGFYLKKLNDEIVEYLTPWAFHEDVDVVFGQKIYASSIIDFIEEREYVQFITDFEMGVCRQECCPEEKDIDSPDRSYLETVESLSDCTEIETLLNQSMDNSGDVVVSPSSSRSILVSAPHHFIFPYVAPPNLSICEQRRQLKSETVDGGDVVQPSAETEGNRKEPVGDVHEMTPVMNLSAEHVMKDLVIDSPGKAKADSSKSEDVTAKKTKDVADKSAEKIPAKKTTKVKKTTPAAKRTPGKTNKKKDDVN